MERRTFRVGGQDVAISAADVVRSLAQLHPETIRTHWVAIDGQRWPPKQVFSAVSGLPRSQFISHEALRVLRALGFETSEWPH